MDVKAMAKSKRSHTKHHQPRKPHNHSKTLISSSSSTSSNVKSSKNESGERNRVSRPSLPSNWARYEEIEPELEEDRVGLVEFGSDGPGRPESDGLVKPKSKGADFRELISEAKKSQLAKTFDSIDESLPDYYQGLGPLLSVRGEDILSWADDEDFLLEGKGTANHEAPFLALDLQALAEQLAEVDLAQRLFIEADLVPPELVSQKTKNSNYQMPTQNQVERKSKKTAQISNKLASINLSGQQEVTDEPSAASTLDNDTNINVVKDTSSRFEGAAAEAELDILLDSFHDNLLPFESSAAQENAQSPSARPGAQSASFLTRERDVSVYEASLKDVPGPSGSHFHGSSLDDELDNLLEETSNLKNQDGFFKSSEVKATSLDDPSLSSASGNHVSKSKVLEDFDSWLDTL